MLSGLVPGVADISLAGRGSFGLVGSVGAELDHLLGAGGWQGADELAGEEDLEHGGLEPDGDDLAGEVPAGLRPAGSRLRSGRWPTPAG
jgi:hypothetical protein